MVKGNVCMFVWSHFVGDARVMRVCSALGEAGYVVDLVAVHDFRDKGLERREVFSDRFNVYRVNGRLPRVVGFPLEAIGSVWSVLLSSRLVFVLFLVAWSVAIFLYPIPAIVVLGMVLIFSVQKVRVGFLRGYIFLQMVWYGLGKRYDIYHSIGLSTLAQGVVCSKLKVVGKGRKRLIYDAYEVQAGRVDHVSWFHGRVEGFLVRFIDKMISENHTRAAYTKELYGFYPEVVHNYPLPSRPERILRVDLYKKLGISEDDPILLYQGGMQVGRGLDKIVEAVTLFRKGVVVFIGDGEVKGELEGKVVEMELGDRVKFVSEVTADELMRYTTNGYLGFQVLNRGCFNHYSASSNKLFEYMMSGVPVIACSFPEIQRVVEKEKVGICVDFHSPESIAEAVNFLIDHPRAREKMQQNCFEARRHYNWEREKFGLLRIYGGLVPR